MGAVLSVLVTFGLLSGCREDSGDQAAEVLTTAPQGSTTVPSDSAARNVCARRIVDDLYAAAFDGDYADSCFEASLRLFPDFARGSYGIGIRGEILRARVLRSILPAWLRSATTEALRLSFGTRSRAAPTGSATRGRSMSSSPLRPLSPARAAVTHREHSHLAGRCSGSASIADASMSVKWPVALRVRGGGRGCGRGSA